MNAPYQLVYDIPKHVKMKPSNELRPIAIRINRSVWIVWEYDIPHRLIAELDDAGCNVYLLPFDMKAHENLLKLAAYNVRTEIRAMVAGARTTCATAARTLATSRKGATKAVQVHRATMAATVKKLRTKLSAYRQAAIRFGIDPDTLGMQAAAEGIESFKAAMLDRAKTYLEAAAELERNNPGDEMASAARNNGGVPACILADYLADRGMKAAKKLRSMFD